MNNNYVKNIVTTGVLIALGLILPIVFHAFSLAGPIFLPMHIPILLGGFLLPPSSLVLIGIALPLLSGILTGMPPLFPTAVQMMFELSVYGVVISLMYNRYHRGIYPALLIAMLAGRLAAGAVSFILLTQFMAKTFSMQMYLTGAVITAFPGILVQIIIIPIMIKLLENANLLVNRKGELYER